MRSVCLWLAAGAIVCGQTTRSTESYSFDGLGGRTRGPQVEVAGDSRTETLQTLNGRSVPVEQVEERVVRSEGATKVIERIIRHFDQAGAAVGMDRVVEEVTKLPDGSSSVKSSTYRRDVSGNMQLAERSATEVHQSGGTETASSVIERPSIDGSLQVAEKREVVADRSPSGEVRNMVVYRPDGNGRFYESAKETVETKTNGPESVENAARYLVGVSGRMELLAQTVRTSVKRPDGSASIVEDVYVQQAPGSANGGGNTQPELKEQRVIERRVSSAGVTEIVSLRQASLADPNRLGPARKVAETVCQGKCP